MSALPPFLPETAPFTPEQRQWLNGFLAGMFSGQNGTPATSAPVLTKGRIPILFGSQSGNAESLAEEFSNKLTSAGFDAPVVNMEDHEGIDLTSEKNILIITSTWGEGDPPDNAAEFWARLASAEHPKLGNLSYSVCGLGDSNYLDFCGMGKKFDARLSELGAKPLAGRADCDVDFEKPAAAWIESVLASIPVAASSTPVTPHPTPAAEAPPPTHSKKNPFAAALLKNIKLNAEDSPRDTRHFELSLEGSGLEYDAGDALGVLPTNCGETVSELIDALGFTGDETVALPGGEEATLREAFTDHYGITIPSKKLIERYQVATEITLDADYLWGREIIDLATEFPQVKLSATEFVAMLGKLQPRLYSISSSPKAHPGEVHLTVAAVRYESHGRQRKGVCSTFLADRCNGSGAKVFVHPSKGFKPPADPATKMIMVGPGTGIAPFRAFLEERQAIGASGDNWLFFGNPHSQTDFLYQSELTAMADSGSLTKLDLAWSRDTGKKVYVQDKMRESAADLWSWLDEGAHFYVCGDAKRMAKDVDQALHEVIANFGGKGEQGAVEYVAQMKKDKRYQRDVY